METKTQSKRQPKPAEMNWLVPALTVKDISKALGFYEKAFGFQKGIAMPGPDGRLVHADMKYKGASIFMMGLEGAMGCTVKTPASSKSDCPAGFYVYCDDVDALFRRAKEAGAVVTSEPTDMFWGDRMTQLKDLDGYNWMFATNVADFDPAKAPKG